MLFTINCVLSSIGQNGASGSNIQTTKYYNRPSTQFSLCMQTEGNESFSRQEVVWLLKMHKTLLPRRYASKSIFTVAYTSQYNEIFPFRIIWDNKRKIIKRNYIDTPDIHFLNTNNYYDMSIRV